MVQQSLSCTISQALETQYLNGRDDEKFYDSMIL